MGLEIGVNTNDVLVDGRAAWAPRDRDPVTILPLAEIVRAVYRHASYGGHGGPRRRAWL